MSLNDFERNGEVVYTVSEWENYARLHASVTTSVQLALYRESCKHLSGSVVDCGCGSAKMAPLLAGQASVTAYTGIDYAQEMVSVARQVVQTLNRSSFTIRHNRIEDEVGQFDGAVSIQSYYAWPEPVVTLKHIFDLLVDGANFVLATPNRELCLEKLLQDAEKELVAHPDFGAFKHYNLKLAGNPQANFISMDGLIRQVQQAGFRVRECHQQHFGGGMNFLVLRKET
ncbi:MAG TPA: class I SAM-dependent methyltransferase [Candidatus Thiothrix moscowensis]|uniref:class I SAM-dependent methyltransferase n=1 Tax=unclassified Thiothrix TaxID=2636184 RepID=UPI0025E3F7DF|nr:MULTISPECIES: class I SAM-dependent methyltransferase [unclassified Thiothrix]HRJ54455.1 class I SAM-dependent methyltransferase [Candidatus Thiothrix moscowensis]HRJ94814.1 class I SAM-dependent methyltransferase [Candidatus Thiothrix moscowensis]